MSVLTYILIFTFIGSIVSLIGGIFLLLTQERWMIRASHFLASFAAGALLGTAFVDLLPEAVEGAGEINIFTWTLAGLLLFFLLERFLHFFHHHHREHLKHESKPVVPLVILGDSVHNFIDGVVIAAAFLVSIPLGIVTALAVAVHEIPQEIGDFGILLNEGVKRGKVILFNLLSASSSLVGALLMFFMRDQLQGSLSIFLALTAGFFIYIATSDLIPQIHEEKKEGMAFWESALLIVGVIVVWVLVVILESAV